VLRLFVRSNGASGSASLGLGAWADGQIVTLEFATAPRFSPLANESLFSPGRYPVPTSPAPCPCRHASSKYLSGKPTSIICSPVRKTRVTMNDLSLHNT